MILSESLPVVLGVAAWGVAGLGMGLAYPGSTLVALGAPSAQSGLAAASLLVAETVGVGAGAGAGGTLIAVAVHLERGLPLGLGWAFVLMACATPGGAGARASVWARPARLPRGRTALWLSVACCCRAGRIVP